jgi:hypothetical protein
MIYFLRHPEKGYIKIGKTINYATRLSQLIALYGDLELLGLMAGYTKQEKALHRQFMHLHVTRTGLGTEWFRPEKDLMIYIKKNSGLTLPLPVESDEYKLINGAFFTSRIREKRESLGWTLTDLLNATIVVGNALSPRTIALYEDGRMNRIDVMTVDAFAKVFGCDWHELFTLNDKA